VIDVSSNSLTGTIAEEFKDFTSALVHFGNNSLWVYVQNQALFVLSELTLLIIHIFSLQDPGQRLVAFVPMYRDLTSSPTAHSVQSNAMHYMTFLSMQKDLNGLTTKDGMTSLHIIASGTA
jgi:hypothetical protein